MTDKYKPLTVRELTKNKFKELVETVDERIIDQSYCNNNTLNLHIHPYEYLNNKAVRIKLTDSLRERGFNVEYGSEHGGSMLTITWNIPSLEEN